mgnify:FL=1
MKSLFLQKLSNSLIPDKETDYIDLYNLQKISNWPLLTVIQHDSTNEDTVLVPEMVIDSSKHKPENMCFLDLEYSEIISFDEEKLVLDAGGEFQGLHRLVIGLNQNEELIVLSCNIIPELSESVEHLIERHSEEEYDILLDNLQSVLENQD